MPESVTHDACERTRRALSLDLDGELSEFSRRLLGRHLMRCGTCSDAQERLVDLTTAIRMLPAVEPRRSPSFDAAWSLPRRAVAKKHLSAGLCAAAAAACAAVTLVGGATPGSVGSGDSQVEHRLAFAQVQHLRAERDLTRS